MDPKDFALATLLQSTEKDIEDYKQWLCLPSHLAQNPMYSASNALNWIKLDKFNDYLAYKSENTPCNAPKHADTQNTPGGASKHTGAAVIEVSDAEPTPSIIPPPLPELVGRKVVLREIINLCSSESDAEPRTPRIKLEAKREPLLALPAGRFHKATEIRISRSEKVQRVVELTEIPARWPVPDVDTAYILDFSTDDRAKKETKGGKPAGLDAFLKAEDQDSWGAGSNGCTKRDTICKVLGDIKTRRSIHKCNGGHKCEFFDPELLTDYQRIEGEDMSVTREIFSRELLQNQTDSGSAAGRAVSFFRVVQRYKKCGCQKPGCDGVPILRKRRDGPSKEGKLMFIGCSKWVKGEKWEHTYAAIPADVDEDILATYFDGSALLPAELNMHGDGADLCARFVHPRHGKQKDCPHVHFREGKAVTGQMMLHACPATKIVYTSKDPGVQKCVVIFRGLHSHPPWPLEKPGHAAKEDVKKCVAAGGTLGETGGHLNNSHTTQAMLGTSLDVKHHAFRDTRRLRDHVSQLKSGGTPAGLLWAGILEDYASDLQLPVDQRYVHHIRMDGAIKIAVAMNPELAALLHDDGVRFLEGDITFKRTKGEMNEWEAAIWYTPEIKRVTIARIYTNSCTKEAFTHLFDAFFSTVKQVTGQAVRFKAFHPKGNLYSIHFDMEAAQVQGLGSCLSKMVLDDPALRALFPSIDPDKLVQLVLKLCSVHLERSTDPLVPLVGQETVDYLNSIRGFSEAVDFENWHKFCKSHENKNLRDWYAHKIQYPWLLPGYNEHLSSFPKGYWHQSPSHTNLVESAHVATNRATKINLLPVEAVRTARIFDARQAASIRAARETCILENRNNHDQVRMRRNLTRTAKRGTYQRQHAEVGDSIDEAQKELAAIAQNKKVATARLKELKAQKKELGRVPRHSTSGRTAKSFSSIPRLVAKEADSDIELVRSSSPVPQASSSSPVSSPAPLLRPLDNDDTDMFPAEIGSQAELPPLEFPAPVFIFTDEELALLSMLPFKDSAPLSDLELFTGFGFNSPALPADTAGLLTEWQDVISPVQSSSTPPDWPRLPPVPESPPTDQSLDAIVLPVRSTRKRHLEVDPADVIDGPRVRKVRIVRLQRSSSASRRYRRAGNTSTTAIFAASVRLGSGGASLARLGMTRLNMVFSAMKSIGG
ncbi:hypothetical protein B0H17DRAFT_1218393 [Mycena rosella]|uniref:Uncharacterized protein n=1 Tax=Mycena rosella TaxID=1033263 RepID=A0AAD7BR13_MYCRO|nr:hypothetical protein B0H17DRAFT_1218393 [Mycena rosella]